MEQICPKNHHLSFFYPLENDFWYNKVDFSRKKKHSYLHEFLWFKVVTFVSFFVWGIPDENIFFNFRIKFRLKFA